MCVFVCEGGGGGREREKGQLGRWVVIYLCVCVYKSKWLTSLFCLFTVPCIHLIHHTPVSSPGRLLLVPSSPGPG